MKKFKLFALAIMAMLSSNAFADALEGTYIETNTGVKYKIVSLDKTAGTYTATVEQSDYATKGAAELTIPSTFAWSVQGADHNGAAIDEEITFKVIGIAANGFKGVTKITSVTIADENVAEIGNSAFEGCTGLVSATIGRKVATVGNDVFKGCTAMTGATFGAGSLATTVGTGIFNGTKIASLDLSTTAITAVSAWFGDGSATLESVSFPNTTTTIADNAFKDCSKLATVTFAALAEGKANVTGIGAGAFSGTIITDLDLTNTKFTTLNELFETTNVKLAKVTLSAELTTIGADAFKGCAKLAELAFAGTSKLTTISATAFETTPSLTALSLPISVTTLANDALKGSSITTLTVIPNKTTGLTINAIAAPKLTTLVVDGDYVKGTIEANAFTTLTSATFKGKVGDGTNAVIKAGAFKSCTKLATLTFEKKVESKAVATGAFGDNANWAGNANTTGGILGLTVTYNPAAADEVSDAFNAKAFGDGQGQTETTAGVKFITTTSYASTSANKVNAMDNVFISAAAASFELTMENNGSGDWYYAKMYNDAPYSIAKDQESGAKVIVYGAYVDNSDANIYMEQLHIIDGKYQIPQNTPVIVKSSTNDKVKVVSGTTDNSMLWDSQSATAKVTNEIAYLATVTIGQTLKENAADTDAAGRAYDNATTYDVYALAKISKYNITWKKFGDSTSLPEGTFYIHCKKSDAARLNVIWLDGSEEGDATAIKTVKKVAENGAIYNLAGQKVNASYKGVVIKDGKKYIQK